jgi:glycosyltransferase involved in cell wall biosynthesis
MKLSILIPTLESRKDSFYELFDDLDDQIGDIQGQFSKVEIHFLRDSGEKSVGAKRQQLLEWATGDYIAFVDDDDMVPDDYVSKILDAIKEHDMLFGVEPDCCSLSGELHWLSNGTTEPFEHSIKHQKWEKKDGVYLRYPNHLNAVRRDLALEVGFKDMGHGEDRDYSDRLKPLLKTEAPIDGVIYHYNCRG